MNNADRPIRLSGTTVTNFGGDASCHESTLNPGFRRGCFDPTVGDRCGYDSAQSILTVNGRDGATNPIVIDIAC
ncbi:hypothetical protein V1L54_01670 [Streptomyces sp. TRM 70361]|uniref:hypothetical protein n=1 Tax=Streptomyces sp. TRM 70361 TaxID=3116553 RepID=UPI002E7B5BB4|nr:hypothetical protein [Streptomyces sp. TRM 70361]MEE1938137.1 hypothetical protein [Streptomyces sp. TRM 70361]